MEGDEEAQKAVDDVVSYLSSLQSTKKNIQEESTAGSVEDAVSKVAHMEAHEGALCTRLNTIADLILAWIVAEEQKQKNEPHPHHLMTINHLKQIGSLLLDQHKAYHLFKSGAENYLASED